MVIAFTFQDTALKITQACLYLLGIFKHPDSKRLTQVGFSSQLAIVLIEAVCSFIGVYNIRWWETVETIYLPYILHSVVDHKASCNSQVTCAGLRGIKFCIKQFLHPDQILLVHLKLGGGGIVTRCGTTVIVPMLIIRHSSPKGSDLYVII